MSDNPPDNENLRSVEWSDNDRQVANKVIVTCGPDGTESVTQLWTADGIASTWTADIAAALDSVPPPTVIVNGVTKTVGVGANFTWDPATYTLTLGTASLEFRKSEPDIRSLAAGQEIADTLLDQMTAQGVDVTILSTTYAGWDAGQVIVGEFYTVFAAPPDDMIITNVHIELKTDEFWEYTISATLGADYQGDYLQRWREVGVASK